jgi:hypothetical protein
MRISTVVPFVVDCVEPIECGGDGLACSLEGDAGDVGGGR